MRLITIKGWVDQWEPLLVPQHLWARKLVFCVFPGLKKF